MNATVDDLLATIGEQQVEIRMSRKQNNELAQALAALREELALEKAKNEEEKKDKKEK